MKPKVEMVGMGMGGQMGLGKDNRQDSEVEVGQGRKSSCDQGFRSRAQEGDDVTWRAPGGICRWLGIQNQGLRGTVKPVGLRDSGWSLKSWQGERCLRQKRGGRRREGRREGGQAGRVGGQVRCW